MARPPDACKDGGVPHPLSQTASRIGWHDLGAPTCSRPSASRCCCGTATVARWCAAIGDRDNCFDEATGYVSLERYAAVVESGYAGIVSKAMIGQDGLVDIYDACDGVCVQRSYADYINYPKRVNAKEAVGSFLWAMAVVEKPTRSA